MLNRLRKHVICEPVLFFVSFACEISGFAKYNLYLRKACRSNTWSAPDLTTQCDDENKGESDDVIAMFNNFQLLNVISSLVFTIFASTYSDLSRKRRIFIVVPLVGCLLKHVVAIAETIFWGWDPLQGMFWSSVAEIFSGGALTLHNFINTYVYDKTSTENRLLRTTVLTIAQAAGTLFGQLCRGFLLRRCGFLVTFVVSFVLYLLCLISTLIFVRDETVEEAYEISFLRHIFNIRKRITEVFEGFVLIAFPKKPKKHVVAIWLLLLIDAVVFFAYLGEQNILYLYFRERFKWDEEKYSIFCSYRTASTTIGSLLGSLVMGKWLKIDEGIIGIFASFWDIIAYIGFCFAPEDWQFRWVPLFDIFHGLALSSCLTQIGQFFNEREFGRLNSTKMIFLTVGVVGAIPGYDYLYRSKKNTVPNAIFLLSLTLNMIIFVLYSLAFYFSRDVRTPDQAREKPTIELEIRN